MKPSNGGPLLGLALFAAAGASCSSSSGYDSAHYDPFISYSYAPAEVYYSSYYWSDPYYSYYLDGAYQPSTAVNPAGGRGGATIAADSGTPSETAEMTTTLPPATSRQSLGEIIRALARGEAVCPGQVTVTPHMIANPCPANGADDIRGGVSITFAGCQLANGAALDGGIEVQTTRTTDDECSAHTTINIMHTVTITDLSYTGPNGRRLVIPNQTATGTTRYMIGQRPSSAAATLDGRMKLFTADGALAADRVYTGDITVTPSPDRSTFLVDGTLNLDDADGTGSTALTMTGLTRTSDCCFPTGGTLSATRTGQRSFGLHVWSFDDACSGGAFFDGRTVMLGRCL
jgi:hypothetical protein